MRDPRDAPQTAMEELRQRLSAGRTQLHAWSVGRYRVLFWAVSILVCVAAVYGVMRLVGLSGHHRYRRHRGSAASPHKVPTQPFLHVVWGRVYRPNGRHEWRRTRYLRQNRVVRTKSQRSVVAFAHDSTFRVSHGSEFNWSLLSPGHVQFTISRGGGWFQLAPQDDVQVNFPGAGRVVVHGEAILEIHVRLKPNTRTWVSIRQGDAVITKYQRLKKPKLRSVEHAGHGARILFVRLTYPVHSGQSMILTAKKNWAPPVHPDNDWQKWNLGWKTVKELHARPRPPRISHPRRPRHAPSATPSPAVSP